MHKKNPFRNNLPPRRTRAWLALCIAASFGSVSAQTPVSPPAEAASAPVATTLPAVRVKATTSATSSRGDYTVRKSAAATGLAQSLRETPQAVSVVTRSLMDDFKLHAVDSALDASTGVVVEKVETDRTYYTARGFDIVNFQVDGIGTPLVYGLVNGDLDTAVYDRVEVIRGANGLMSGVGNPSATINFVRKRATPSLQASAGLSFGSWDDKRLDAEVSGPLNEARSLRGLLVLALQDKVSYLDRYHHKKSVVYGTIEADLGDDTLVTLGHTQQKNRPQGSMWGALPLYFTDGSPTHYDVSTSTSPAWTYWNTNTDVSFIEAQHDLGHQWQAKAVFTHTKVASRGKLFYAYGTPDPGTGLGVLSWPSMYDLDNKQDMLDVRATGPLLLGGRTHEVVLGASISRVKLNDQSTDGQGIGTPLPDLAGWDGTYPEPVFDVPGGSSSFTDKQRSLYAAMRVNPADALKLTVGANATSLKSQGVNYDERRERDFTKVVPYFGAVYDIDDKLSLYASHTAIFNPQSELDATLNTLAPVEGKSVELGLKAELLDKQLNASLAFFKSNQNNLATWSDYVGIIAVYTGVDTKSQGIEIDVAGALTPRLKVNAGYTHLSIKNSDGGEARTFSPRQVFRVSGTYQVLDALKLGAALNWRSRTWRDEGNGVFIRQASYALLNLMARYNFNKHFSATLNVNNATNEKYLTSIYWNQGYYGAPRNASLGVNWVY